MTIARTLFEKTWASHVTVEQPDTHCLLYVDRHLIQDGSRPAFEMLAARGLTLRRPDRTTATPDHYVPTTGGGLADIASDERRAMVETITENARAAGVTLFGLDDPRQGIVHVIGMTEVSHVLATQTIWQQRPRTMRITVGGKLAPERRRRTSSWRSSPKSAPPVRSGTL